MLLILSLLCLVTLSTSLPNPSDGLYDVGVGIYDVTGPAAGVNMMGYANPSQINSGIHIRLFSRAYIVDDGENRVVFVSADMGMMATIVKIRVVERLSELYGDRYNTSNVMLSGTHTHSGPAGFMQYLLYDITSLGFIQETHDAIVEGIVKSIQMAHDSVVPARIYSSSGELLDASINRSPSSYANNPESERLRYQYNTDKTMTLVKFVAETGEDLGMINWFAVHPTSMNNTNQLISGDNKGYASQLFESEMNDGARPGKGKFVAAFAQTNCGDVSPNIMGPRCIDTGEVCDILTSTCGGRVQQCIASGPGKDMEESTKIIGERQFAKAKELFTSPDLVPLKGQVKFISQFVDMSNYTVTLENGTEVNTCKPALGYSFAAGTTDGPGAFDFTQGMTTGNAFWDSVVSFINPTEPEQVECQAPKPVLLDTGNFYRPYAWHPTIMETQLSQIGELMIIAVPGEFTTMSGRRMREQLSVVMEGYGTEIIPVIAGLSNVYSHYITTREEYEIQRYEGASTLFGQFTLEAYIQQYSELAVSMTEGADIPLGPEPPNLLSDQISLLPRVFFDGTQFGYSYGDVLAEPYPFAYAGETIVTKFASGHPRNNVMLGGSFLTVEKKGANGTWTVVATDADWDTKFSWERTSTLLGTSIATIEWTVSDSSTDGIFRITHSGHSKTFIGDITPYTGITQEFQVAPRNSSLLAKKREEFDKKQNSMLGWLSDIFM